MQPIVDFPYAGEIMVFWVMALHRFHDLQNLEDEIEAEKFESGCSLPSQEALYDKAWKSYKYLSETNLRIQDIRRN